MGSLRNESGVKEVKVDIKNVEEEMKKNLEKSTSVEKSEEEIPPLDVKDYEELGLIIDLGELGESSYENAGIDFNSMFSDFFPADEEKVMEITPYNEKFTDPSVMLSSSVPSMMELEKLMEIPTPDGEGSSLTTGANWDFELMEWIWSPYGYEEFLPNYNQE